ncbi:3-sulfolactaldehyde reductase [Streptomyces fumanus]
MQSTTAGIGALGELAGFAREHGLVFDAPVLGTRQPAEAGQLLVLAAGPADARPTVTPVFDAVGSRTVWTGEDGAAGSATRLKLVANSWVIAATNATGEVLALAEALNVDPDRFFDAIARGPLDMGYLRAKAALVRDGALTPPQFAVATAAKDARLIVEAGERAGLRWTGPPPAPNASPAPPPRDTATRTWPPSTSPASTSPSSLGPRNDQGVHVSKPPLPPEAVDLLRRPNPCVMATLRSDGTPVSTATWYLWEDDGRVLINLDEAGSASSTCAATPGSPSPSLTPTTGTPTSP